MTRRGPSRATWFRAAAAGVAVVAALGPDAAGARDPVLRVLLVDVSASTGLRTPRDTDLAALRAGLAGGDAAAVVAFADGAMVIAQRAPPRELEVTASSVAPWATSLAGALHAAASLRNPGERLELLVATDARVTDDAASLDRAVSMVQGAGGADLRVLPCETAVSKSVIEELRGPGRALVGEVVTLEAAGVAGPAGATVELIGSGSVIETRRVERAGAFRIVFARVADVPGLATWEARTGEWPDAPPATARVVVAAPGAVALLHAGVARVELVAALGHVSAAVDVRSAAGRDVVADALPGHDAVVVDDVPQDADLARSVGDDVLAFVRQGGGALVLGGTLSFLAAARSSASEGLDGASPLLTAPPDDAGAVLYLAIDGSGSMAEPWPGVAGGIARDTAVRAAADALVRAAREGTHLFVRRFRERLVPDAPPADVALEGTTRDAGLDAVRRLPAPGGSTAFLPVLAEAFDVLASRTERTRIALLLTDGRSSEDVAALRAAVTKLLGAGVRVAVVVPGRVDGRAADASLLQAIAGSGATVRSADDPAKLADVLVDAERAAHGYEPLVTDRLLEATGDAAPIVAPSDVPPHAARLNRTWPAPDATVLVRTTDGIPVAALRRMGRGWIGAIAAHALDPEWLDGDHGTALVGAMLRAVRRRASAAVRVEIEGDVVRARFDVAPGAPLPRWVEFKRTDFLAGFPGMPDMRLPLRDAGGGLVAADLPRGGILEDLRFVADDGTVLASVARDTPAPLEVRSPPPIDVDLLAERLRPAAPPRGIELRPWLAGLAALLLILGSVKSGSRPTR